MHSVSRCSCHYRRSNSNEKNENLSGVWSPGVPTSRNTTRNKRCFHVKKAEDKGNTVEDLDQTEMVALEDYLNNEENSEEEQSESDSDEEPENLVDLSFHQLTSLIESSPLKLSSDVKAVVEKVLS